MKNIFIVVLFLISIHSAIAQTDIISAFNFTDSGRSIILLGSKTFNSKNEFGLGLRYNINKLAHNDDQNNSYRKRLYATNFSEHLGVEAYYHRYFNSKWPCVQPYFFYDMQVTHSGTRNRMFFPVMPHETYGTLYDEVVDFFGPFTWFEQTIGFGFKANISKQIYIYQKFGGGVSFILGKDEKRLNTYDKFEWEFAELIQLGLVYRLKD